MIQSIILCLKQLKSKESAPSHTTSDPSATPKPQLKVTSLLADEFRSVLHEEVETLVDETLPGDASLLLPPIQIAVNCLQYGLKRCFTEFRDARSRSNTTATISKFAPILEEQAQAVFLSSVLPACFSKHKLKLAPLYNCGPTLLHPPLPSQADMHIAVRKKLLPSLNRDALRQTAELMPRWEAARNPEFDRDSDYCVQDLQDHDDGYKAKKNKRREEERQKSNMDLMADGLMPLNDGNDDNDENFLHVPADFHDP